MTTPEPVIVTDVAGIPCVHIPDPHAATATELVDSIMRQLTQRPPATVEQVARTVGAAVAHHDYGESYPAEMAELRWLVAADPGIAPGDVLERLHLFADHVRRNAAVKGCPAILDSAEDGVSVAVGGAAGVAFGAAGRGDQWQPGEGAGLYDTTITSEYPDQSHPVRRLWAALGKRI